MKQDKTTWSDKNRLEFTKQLEYFFEVSHPQWRRMLTYSFVKGIITGLGVFLGGTIGVALLLWILSGLGHVPFLDDAARNTRETIEQGK